MGKRKGRKKPPPNLKKALNVLPKSFDCPFCLTQGSIQVTMYRITLYYFVIIISSPNGVLLALLSQVLSPWVLTRFTFAPPLPL